MLPGPPNLQAADQGGFEDAPEATAGYVYRNPAYHEWQAQLSSLPTGADAGARRRQLMSQGIAGGFVFASTDDADDTSHCQDSACGSLYPNVMRQGYNLSRIVNGEGILALGFDPTLSDSSNTAKQTFMEWLENAGLTGVPVTYASSPAQVGAGRV